MPAARLTLPAVWPVVLGASLLLAACGGGGTTPHPVSVSGATRPTPTPEPVTPTPTVNYDTAEYRRSNAATAGNTLPAWEAGASGKGVTIGIVDTGIDAGSSEFAGRISSASRDVTGRGRSIQDEDGHGTSVAMVAAAARDDKGVVGIAPEATLAIMRADNGDCATGCQFTDAALATGIDAAVSAGARVINISLGGDGASAQLRESFRRATSAGVVLVMSAGNDGKDTIGALPASALSAADPRSVIVVGATSGDGVISDFSNRAGAAASNYIAALGDRVYTLDNEGKQWLMSGTSFATPSVTAAIALLAQYHPKLTSADLVDILLSSADDAGARGTDGIYGRGTLNIGRALSPIGTTSLAGTTIAIPVDAGGSLGAAMGSGLLHANALAAVPIEDSYGRDYRLDLTRRLRTASPRRLGGRLQSAALAEAVTGARVGPFAARLTLRAEDRAPAAPADAFRAQTGGVEALGFAVRGVDARAGQRNPLRETRLSLAAGGLQLTAASGGRTDQLLPGSAAAGFVSDDALTAESQEAAPATRMFALAWHDGPLTLAAAASHERDEIALRPGLPRPASHSRLTLAAHYQAGAFDVSARLARTADAGALLGTQLDPAWGLTGGHSHIAGLAVGWQRAGFALRASLAAGRHQPHFAEGGLLRAAGAWRSQAWALSAEAPLAVGQLSLRVAQPLVVTHGAMRLANGVALPVAATARERATEIGYARGKLALAAFHRSNAANQPGLADNGAAISWRTSF